MGNPAIDALSFIVGAVLSFFALLVAIRFVMQVIRADYHNPFAQLVMKLTDPLVIPMRRYIPSIQGYDTSSGLLAFATLLLKLLLFKAMGVHAYAIGTVLNVSAMPIGKLVVAALFDLIYLLFNVFIFALIIRAIMSWIPAMQGHPVEGLLKAITEPVLRPVRKIMPPINGLDLSVFVTIIGLFALRILIMGFLIKLL